MSSRQDEVWEMLDDQWRPTLYFALALGRPTPYAYRFLRKFETYRMAERRVVLVDRVGRGERFEAEWRRIA